MWPFPGVGSLCECQACRLVGHTLEELSGRQSWYTHISVFSASLFRSRQGVATITELFSLESPRPGILPAGAPLRSAWLSQSVELEDIVEPSVGFPNTLCSNISSLEL